MKSLLHHSALEPLVPVLRTAPFAIRLVGGAVRDCILKHPVQDFDFAAACLYPELKEFFRQSPCKIVRENPEYGNLLFIFNSRCFDITILRRDQKSDGRHATIVPTQYWRIDAERRDFTINALSLDFDGQLHDPLQQSIADIREQRLRFIGASRQRIREDYLRILRFFRFQALLPFSINPDDLTIIREERFGLRRLARTRIRDEIQKILETSTPLTVLRQMTDCGLWDNIFSHPTPQDLGFLPHLSCPNPDWGLRLAAWFRGQPAAAAALSHDLALSRKESRQLQQRLSPPDLPLDNPLCWLHRYDRALSLDYWWLYAAEHADPAFYQALRTQERPQMPLSGAILAKHGLSGDQICQALNIAEQAWYASGCTLDREELFKICKKST